MNLVLSRTTVAIESFRTYIDFDLGKPRPVFSRLFKNLSRWRNWWLVFVCLLNCSTDNDTFFVISYWCRQIWYLELYLSRSKNVDLEKHKSLKVLSFKRRHVRSDEPRTIRTNCPNRIFQNRHQLCHRKVATSVIWLFKKLSRWRK